MEEESNKSEQFFRLSEPNNKESLKKNDEDQVSIKSQDENNTFRNGTSSYIENFRHENMENNLLDFPLFNESFNCLNSQSLSIDLPSQNSENQFSSLPETIFSNSFQQDYQPPQYKLSLEPLKRQLSSYLQPLNAASRNSTKEAQTTTGSNQSIQYKQRSKEFFTRLYLNNIVNELSYFNGFFTSVETLSKIFGMNYINILEVINSNRNIFSIKTDDSDKVIVELCPKLEICYHHIGSFGCTKEKCLALHICADFINDKCPMQDCPFGHIWTTDHNNLILKEYFLNNLPNLNLHLLIRNVLGKIIIPEICPDYRQNICVLGDECNKLHICFSYVWSLGNCSNGNYCFFSHNIRDSKCLILFQNFGISSNESIGDLLKILKYRCLEGGQAVQRKRNNILNEQVCNSFQGIISTTEQYRNINNIEKTAAQNRERCKNSQSEINNAAGIWPSYGNFDKPKICIENINKKCESKECIYLHYDKKSHWQFGIGNMWYDFHSFHCQLLDQNYSNVNCNIMLLPKLHPRNVNDRQTYLYNLMGEEYSIIYFEDMKMECKGVTTIYDVRHLTTESYAVDNDMESTEFKWYFQGNDYKWNLFRNANFSSRIIEKAYQEKSFGIYNLKTSDFTYSLDFSKMIQTNLNTKTVRNLKRRPFVKQNISGASNDKITIPEHWKKMHDNEEYMVATLSSGNKEYDEICQMIKDSLPLINIVNIFKIQNPYLWKQFKNKQAEIKKKYNDIIDLNVKKLFYGLDSNYLHDICRDNIDFRIHGNSSEEKLYGDGTYFYNSASDAVKNCMIDFMGNKTILVTDVIIGIYSVGSEAMTRPPLNPFFHDTLCEATTDDLQSPNVFVKYNKQEYYPAYLVEFE